MNQVDILIEGYAKVTPKGWIASGTTTLITTDGGKRIITDPGTNRELLLKSLEKRKLSVNDIDFVFITHRHPDHCMLMGIFPNARVVDVEALDWQAEAADSPKMIPDTDITIMATPGHEYAHGVLIVPTQQGTVVVAGDNFWWSTEEEQVLDVNKKDEFAENMEELIKSRKMILDLADWVIPGHGKMFANKK